MAPTPPKGPCAVDTEVDLLVVGSGTGMAAALFAHEQGLQTLVVEKTAWVGGSTARSGGAFWVPHNPALEAANAPDAHAPEYLDAVVGQSAPAERRRAFLRSGPAAIALLLELTPLKFFWARGYPDYHPEKTGGEALGRTCESLPFDLSKLGAERKRFRPGVMEAPFPMPVTGADYRWLNLITRLPFKAFPHVLKRLLQGLLGLLIGRRYVAGGQALAAGLFAGLIARKIPVWTRTSLVELLMEDTRAVGAVVEQDGKRVRVRARRGVVLAAGGFDHNTQMRERFQSARLAPHASLGAEGNTGDAIRLAQSAGAAIALMSEAWWFPAVAPLPGNTPLVLLAERSLPGSFMVDDTGHRFINEAADYMSFGQRLLALEKEGRPIREMWMVFDETYKNNFMIAASIYPRVPIAQTWFDAKIAAKGSTPQQLAAAMGVEEAAFCTTLSRFNAAAEAGADTEFQRGASAYDRYYGDPTVKPNPNLRALHGQLFAIKIVLSDLGTCGGLVADEHGRVLREDRSVVEGLYAIGNTAANVFGSAYPGAGATIGQGLVFAYIAALDAAAKKTT